jgi:hypothetical protein
MLLPELASDYGPPTFATQVTGLIGMHHHTHLMSYNSLWRHQAMDVGWSFFFS